MKNLNVFIYLGVMAIIFSSCNENTYELEQQSITDEIDKIETIYEGTDKKDETKINDNTPTSLASQDFIDKYMSSIYENRDLTLNKNELKSGAGQVGVISNGSCGNYPVFEIWMDGNDGSNKYD